ncbi:MAG: hypothetical protein Q9187_005947 [Circinaria calcarea]
MSYGPPLLRPLPRRSFEVTPASTEPSSPLSPDNESNQPDSRDGRFNGGIPPNRTRSILNLTSSTLFGIYSPTENDGSREDINTPWGTGTVTPQSPPTPSCLRASVDDQRPLVTGIQKQQWPQKTQSRGHIKITETIATAASRTALLFIFGVAYGVIVTHLHDDQRLAPVKVEGIDRFSWRYLIFWGIAGVGLGTLLPWVDVRWEKALGDDDFDGLEELPTEDLGPSESKDEDEVTPSSRAESGLGADWNPVVRSVGAFVGIAFAIRRLPWQSTLQVSLTLALVNPVLWYLIDRSKPGFILSAVVGITGTALLLGVNPDMVPPPATPSPKANAPNISYERVIADGLISNESIGVSTWIASVLFCSCIITTQLAFKLYLAVSDQL